MSLALGAVTGGMPGFNPGANQRFYKNPTFLFFLGGFLMLFNLGVSQFNNIAYATATAAQANEFYLILGAGLFGIFFFLLGFESLLASYVWRSMEGSRLARFFE